MQDFDNIIVMSIKFSTYWDVPIAYVTNTVLRHQYWHYYVKILFTNCFAHRNVHSKWPFDVTRSLTRNV